MSDGNNPNPNPNPNPPETPPAPPANPPAPSGEWFAGFNDDLKGYVQNKGFKGPDAVVDAYRNLEKLHGVPQERLLKLPEKLDDASLAPIFQRLGRPEKPEGYGIAPAEGGDENFVKFAQGMFHEAGLTKSQGEKLAAKWNEYTKVAQENHVKAHNTKIQQENEALKTEWGQAYDQNVEAGRNAVAALGLDKETLDKLENAMGFGGLMKFAHSLGAKIGEHGFISEKGKGNGFNVMTPAAAKSRIESLKADKEWTSRYLNNGVAEKEEMEKLLKLAYPSQ